MSNNTPKQSSNQQISILQKLAGLAKPSVAQGQNPVGGQVSLNPAGLVGAAMAGIANGGQAGQILTGGGGQAVWSPSNTANTAIKTPWQMFFAFPSHLFQQGVPLLTGLVVENVDNQHFLLNVWKMCENPNPNHYGVIQTQRELNPTTYIVDQGMLTLLFSDSKARDRFADWYGKYQNRFGGTIVDEYVPTFKAGQKISGYPIEMSKDTQQYSFHEELSMSFLEDWVWIVANTHEPVLFANGFWIFENESEAVMFKLKGGK